MHATKSARQVQKVQIKNPGNIYSTHSNGWDRVSGLLSGTPRLPSCLSGSRNGWDRGAAPWTVPWSGRASDRASNWESVYFHVVLHSGRLVAA